MDTKLCQLFVLAAVVACIAADIHPPNYRPLGPRGPPPHVKRPYRVHPRPPHGPPKFRPAPVHLGRAPSINRPFKVAPPSAPPSRPKIAPAKKFSPSPPAGPAHYVPAIQSNNDVIHTIPAPNLGPNSGYVPAPPALVSSVATPIVPLNSVHSHGYEVHEDASKSAFGLPFYAPDPDPRRPAPQVPITRDPFSQPSVPRTPLDRLIQQQFEASVPHVVKVSPPKSQLAHLKEAVNETTTFYGDHNSRFLQAFQDKYHKYEAEAQRGSSSKLKNDIDYDSGAEVRYSFGPAPASHDQDDAASEFYDDETSEEKDEILEDSGSMEFGSRLKPKN